MLNTVHCIPPSCAKKCLLTLILLGVAAALSTRPAAVRRAKMINLHARTHSKPNMRFVATRPRCIFFFVSTHLQKLSSLVSLSLSLSLSLSFSFTRHLSCYIRTRAECGRTRYFHFFSFLFVRNFERSERDKPNERNRETIERWREKERLLTNVAKSFSGREYKKCSFPFSSLLVHQFKLRQSRTAPIPR